MLKGDYVFKTLLCCLGSKYLEVRYLRTVKVLQCLIFDKMYLCTRQSALDFTDIFS